MTKKELVTMLAVLTEKPAEEVNKFLEELGGVIRSEVSIGGRVKLPRVGTFKRVVRAARKGFDLKTLEKIDIPGKLAVKFSAVKGFMG